MRGNMRSFLLVILVVSLSACSRRPANVTPKEEKNVASKDEKPALPIKDAINVKEPDLFKVGDAVFKRFQTVGYDNLSRPERVFVCVWDLEGEVYNGGFDQYYFNWSGDQASDAVSALQAIGANQTAEILRKTNALFGNASPAPNRNDRREQLLALSAASKKNMEDYEKEFVQDKERIQELLAKYVSANAEAFTFK